MSAAKRLRSRLWFDDTHYPDMTALYLERYLNYGLTREELQSGRPIIGIAQTGSDLVPCGDDDQCCPSRATSSIRATTKPTRTTSSLIRVPRRREASTLPTTWRRCGVYHLVRRQRAASPLGQGCPD